MTVSSEEVERGKPAPDVYLEAVRRLGVRPEDSVAVEDSENGIKAAKAAGMRVIALPNPEYPPGPDALELADAVIGSPAELLVCTLSRPMSTPELSDHEYLFTSESVTEGHPDKVADQISDGVLDAVLAEDPTGRVACETLVNTGLVVVSGEISTDTYVDIQDIARKHDPPDRLHGRRPRLLGRQRRRDQRDRQAVAGHRAGRGQRARDAHRHPPTRTSSTWPEPATRA